MAEGAAVLQGLCRLGWNLLATPELAALRGGTQGLLLAPRLAEALQARRFHHKGQSHPLSAAGIAEAVRQVAAPSLAEGLLPANEQLYNLVMGGVTVSELMPDGKRHQPTVALIDWHDPAANRWDVAELPPLLSAQGRHHCTPGLVCFVNGIPLVVIEAAATLDEALARHQCHQRQDEIPQLYAYAQLLLALGPAQARYGVTGMAAGQWPRWRDEDPGGAYVPPTEPERLLAALLRPGRLLEWLRVFVLFDREAGKVVARPAQFFATRALLSRLLDGPSDAPRPGGRVCQAPGSGLGFTMAFAAKALLLHRHLPACRVVVVADRPGLQDRLARNCRGSGSFGPARAGTGRDVAWRIGQGSERLVFTTPRRFGRALQWAECRNPGVELVLLVDEDGWRQGGPALNLHAWLRRVLPNAACVAFSATCETAASPFGPVLHAYPMQQALADGVVRPPHEPARWGEPVAQEVHEPAGVYQVPATSASTRGESTWLAILRSAAGDAGFEAVAAERWADEARRVQGVVQDALQEHSLNPRDIEAAVRQALLPRLFALMGLERARAAIDQMIRAAGVGPPHRHVEAATDRR